MNEKILSSGYFIERRDDEKKVLIHFGGFVKPEMVQDYFNDYAVLKKSVDTKNTTLILVGGTLKPFPKELEGNLMELYKDYTSFNKVYVVKPEIGITLMQIQRVIKAAHIENHFEFVNSLDAVK